MQLITNFVGYLVICWVAADFLSGVIHWAEDRYANENWPIIGKFVAKPNQLHHAAPFAFLAGSYWHRNWTTIVLAMPFFFISLPSKWAFIFLVASQGNEIHAWSHQRCNAIIRTFQATGMLQSPREHGSHHRAPFDVRYCVLSNWLNPILDGIGFWSAIEFAIARIIGVDPIAKRK